MVKIYIRELLDDEFEVRLEDSKETICKIMSEEELINFVNEIDELLRERRKRGHRPSSPNRF